MVSTNSSLVSKLKTIANPALLAGFVALCALGYSKNIKTSTPPKNYIAPPELKHFTFGYDEPMADILWIRAIQDLDFCSQKVNQSDCKSQSWLYQMINQITILSPDFRMPYAAGSLALTILINDYEGASKIFDKAVERFPKDWPILSRAAYHAIYEEHDKLKAARLLKQAAENGGPPWYYSLSGRLYAEGGELELGEALLNELKESNQPQYVIDRLSQKLAEHRKKLGK
jgi:hypothetical protein